MTTKTETRKTEDCRALYTGDPRALFSGDRRNLYTPALFSGLELVRDSVRTLPKTATGHGYRYTPLDEILDYIRPILKKAELVMFQQTEHDGEGRVGVTTVILAKDGGHLASTVFAPEPYRNRTTTVETLIPTASPIQSSLRGYSGTGVTLTNEKDVSQMSAIQRAGCEITYLRRYSLASVLGLASDEEGRLLLQCPFR